MKLMDVEVENRAVKNLKGSFVRIDSENNSGIIVRTSEYDPVSDKQVEIPMDVKIWRNFETVFSGSIHELYCKLMKDTKSAKGVVNILFNHINKSSFDINTMVELIARQHRTLQQSFTRLCVAWLRHLSKLNENQYDARNEASVKLAKKMLADVKDDGLPFI